MVPWDVETELWLMSAPAQGYHHGPWLLADSSLSRQNVGWSPLWLHNFSPEFYFGRHYKFFLWLFTYCSQIMWKGLWNLRTMLSWAWRTGEGEAKRKIRAWGLLGTPPWHLFATFFSAGYSLVPRVYGQAKFLHSTLFSSTASLQPEPSKWAPILMPSTFFSPLTLPYEGTQLCKHQNTGRGKERENKLKKKKKEHMEYMLGCGGEGTVGKEMESKTGWWDPRRWSGLSHW